MAASRLPAHAEWARSPNEVAYRQVRDNVTQWAEEIPGLDRIQVPACPEWTVRDVIAHLVEIGWKVASRSGETGSQPPFPGPDAEPGELVRTWHAVATAIDHVLPHQPGLRSHILVMDALTHELDIRQALGLQAPADHPAMRGAIELLVVGFGRSVRQRGLPALRIETSGAQWVAGEGEPEAVLIAGRYDLYRSLAGRRTPKQIAELAWSSPAGPWLPAFEWGPFHPPAERVEHPLTEVEAA